MIYATSSSRSPGQRNRAHNVLAAARKKAMLGCNALASRVELKHHLSGRQRRPFCRDASAVLRRWPTQPQMSSRVDVEDRVGVPNLAVGALLLERLLFPSRHVNDILWIFATATSTRVNPQLANRRPPCGFSGPWCACGCCCCFCANCPGHRET